MSKQPREVKIVKCGDSFAIADALTKVRMFYGTFEQCTARAESFGWIVVA
ncbi:hypothetical protein [Burkholderia stagnalis]|nr:hypothetical protein [Burkholderia stagnalis]